jgi:hypothetical protein
MRNPLPAGMRKSVTITMIPLVGRRATRRRVAPGSEFRLVTLRDGNFNFIQTKAAPIAS